MKDNKQLFERILQEEEGEIYITEAAKEDIKKLFKGDNTFDKLNKAAKKSENKIPDFIAYLLTSKGKEIESIMKKYKMDWEDLSTELTL